MRWSDLKVGDVLLDVDSGTFAEACDFVVIAVDDATFTSFDLSTGALDVTELKGAGSSSNFSNCNIPGYYEVIRGAVTIQESVTEEDVVTE